MGGWHSKKKKEKKAMEAILLLLRSGACSRLRISSPVQQGHEPSSSAHRVCSREKTEVERRDKKGDRCLFALEFLRSDEKVLACGNSFDPDLEQEKKRGGGLLSRASFLFFREEQSCRVSAEFHECPFGGIQERSGLESRRGFVPLSSLPHPHTLFASLEEREAGRHGKLE